MKVIDKFLRLVRCFRTADAFEWSNLDPIDAQDVQMYLNSTDAVSKDVPIAIALQIHDRLEEELTETNGIDAMRMSELKGGMKAMKMFAKALTYNVQKAKVVG